MLLSPIAVCEVVWAEIVFWSKFPAVRKIIMKLDYRLCVRCYYIVTVIAPPPPPHPSFLEIQNWEACMPNVYSTALHGCETP